MIAGIGIDIIEVARVKRLLERNPEFKDRVYSQAEIDYCESKADPGMSYAVRFAAKEAFMKALGTGWNHEVAFKDIETVNRPDGSPEMVIHDNTRKAMEKRHISNIHISLSHEKDYAVAYVVLEKVDT